VNFKRDYLDALVTSPHVSLSLIDAHNYTFIGIISFFVPCLQFGRNAEAIGENCLTYGLSQIVPILGLYCRAMVRGKIRDQKSIPGSCLMDLILILFCYSCTLAQEGQELAGTAAQQMSRE
jgi:Cys-rich protein (TIGR01571 family)